MTTDTQQDLLKRAYAGTTDLVMKEVDARLKALEPLIGAMERAGAFRKMSAADMGRPLKTPLVIPNRRKPAVP